MTHELDFADRARFTRRAPPGQCEITRPRYAFPIVTGKEFLHRQSLIEACKTFILPGVAFFV